MQIKAVIFDLDGTITEPYFDFDAIKREMGLDTDVPILEAMENMSEDEKYKIDELLSYHEQKAIEGSALNPGTRETLQELKKRGIPVGILTRNRKENAVEVTKMHGLEFNIIIGREDGPVKPDAFGVKHICSEFGVKPEETLMVGDYLFDLLCGKEAGAVPVLFASHKEWADFKNEAEYIINDIKEVINIIKEYE